MQKKIHIFGDSHGNSNFKNIKYLNVHNNYLNGITLHRVGRDKLNLINYPNFKIKNNDIVIYQYGEIDCRCHIGKQLLLGRELTEIINSLVDNYIDSINLNKNIYENLSIIIACIPPPMEKEYYESLHGPITHEFPFIGTNEERVLYTKLMNEKIKEECIKNNFYFLDYYDHYINDNNTLEIQISDNNVHINDNSKVLDELYKIVDPIIN